jgi:2'-5' RNA ligase
MRELNERVARFRPRLPSASWVRPESQHVTFAFLGEQPDAIVDRIAGPVAAAVARIPAFEASMRGGGFFPNARRARVGWIGLDPEAGFVAVAQAVRGAVTGAGASYDGSEFRPHLTLMRIRDPWPPASTTLFQTAIRDYVSPAFRVESVTLYSSRLRPEGAIHTPLNTFPLGA